MLVCYIILLVLLLWSGTFNICVYFCLGFVQDEDEHNRVPLIEIVSCFCRLEDTHFILTMTRGYTFYFNIIYMYLYQHVVLFKNVNINFMLYYFIRDNITQYVYILL